MSKFIRAALNNEDITIYGDGSQTRTFCYIDDNTEACLNAMKDKDSVNEVFNIGSDSILTIKELALEVIRLTNSNSKIIHLPALEDGDMTRRQPDIGKMKQLLNRNLVPLEKGILNVIEAIKMTSIS